MCQVGNIERVAVGVGICLYLGDDQRFGVVWGIGATGLFNVFLITCWKRLYGIIQ